MECLQPLEESIQAASVLIQKVHPSLPVPFHSDGSINSTYVLPSDTPSLRSFAKLHDSCAGLPGLAAATGNTKAVEWFFDNTQPWDDDYGKLLIRLAAFCGQKEIVDSLVAKQSGGDGTVKRGLLKYAILGAAEAGDFANVQYYHGAIGSPTQTQDTASSSTPPQRLFASRRWIQYWESGNRSVLGRRS